MGVLKCNCFGQSRERRDTAEQILFLEIAGQIVFFNAAEALAFFDNEEAQKERPKKHKGKQAADLRNPRR